MIDDEQGCFREGRGCVDQIFNLKHIGENAHEKMQSVCGFYRHFGWYILLRCVKEGLKVNVGKSKVILLGGEGIGV